jgi:hypothetical protein
MVAGGARAKESERERKRAIGSSSIPNFSIGTSKHLKFQFFYFK